MSHSLVEQQEQASVVVAVAAAAAGVAAEVWLEAAEESVAWGAGPEVRVFAALQV